MHRHMKVGARLGIIERDTDQMRKQDSSLIEETKHYRILF